MIARIATGEIEDTTDDPTNAHQSRGIEKGSGARAAKVMPEPAAQIARIAPAGGPDTIPVSLAR